MSVYMYVCMHACTCMYKCMHTRFIGGGGDYNKFDTDITVNKNV